VQARAAQEKFFTLRVILGSAITDARQTAMIEKTRIMLQGRGATLE
jgi:hypothetical protein